MKESGKSIVLLVLLISLSTSVWAQRTKTVELKPIYNQGFRYFYDMKRVATPYALQIPMQSLNDDEVNRRYKNFNLLSDIGTIVSVAPFVALISISASNTTTINPDVFLLWILIALGADLTFDFLAHGQLKKGIERYNQLIVVPVGQTPGVSLKYRF